MTGWVVRQFRGIAPRFNPRLLADNQAQTAANCRVSAGSLVPLKSNLPVLTLPKAGTIQTIHRFGQDIDADDQYWFHWAADVDVVRGPVFGDTQERTYWTGDGVPKVSDNAIALSGGTGYPMNAYTLGIPAPLTAPVAVVVGTGEANVLAETRLYLETFVSGWGEEGEPSLASNAVDVFLGQSVELALSAVPTGAYNLTFRRIYRSVTGTAGTPYLFVAEIPIATAAYTDSVTADALGEQLPTLTYSMPPAGLQGLVAMPGGVMAGFVGRDVFFCEPFKPHAYPVGYSMTVESEIVALGVFDTTLLVLTKGQPALISGSDPASYSMVHAEVPQACVSKRSVVNIGGGVCFASPDGLFLVGGGSTRNLTEATFSPRAWRALNPKTLSGYLVDGCYVGFTSTTGFVLDLATGEMVTLDWTASAGYYDALRDALFLVINDNQLVKFDAGTVNQTVTYRSKAFYLPAPKSMGAARVEAAGYPVTFTVQADKHTIPVVPTLRVTNFAACSGVLTEYLDVAGKCQSMTYTQPVPDEQGFRLPSVMTGKQWEFEVSGAFEVTSAGIAETMQELTNG